MPDFVVLCLAFFVAFLLEHWLSALVLYPRPQPTPAVALLGQELRVSRRRRWHRRKRRKPRHRRHRKPTASRPPKAATGVELAPPVQGDLLGADEKHLAPPLELRELRTEVPAHVG